MIYTYQPEQKHIDLSTYTQRHSGDKTVTYKIVNGVPISLSLFYPPTWKQTEFKQRFPLMLFIHGGGWTSHKIFEDQTEWAGDYLGYLARYYADRGFVSVSIDYRLAQKMAQKEEYQLLDLYSDCVEAVDYVLDHAIDYRIDTEQVFLLGESAGGHLAGLIATRYKRKGFAFKTVFLVNAITELVEDKGWNRYVPQHALSNELAGLTVEERGQYLSPLYNIHVDNCPVVLIHGTADSVVKTKHSLLFYDRMQALSRKCDLHLIEDTRHAFLLTEYVDNINACRIGIEIINMVFKDVVEMESFVV